ncbi:glutamic acid-rich protein-like isoform X1 [Pelobates fuscus]|uniref:glutamic acid-rich protein-like isoform X1 n=1 Tax=Pelobates fuscus TaxID=191477 RepID=UPI002FE4DBB2
MDLLSRFETPHNSYTCNEDHKDTRQFKDISLRSCDDIHMCPLLATSSTCSWHKHFYRPCSDCHQALIGLKDNSPHTAVPNGWCIMYPLLNGQCDGQVRNESNIPGSSLEAPSQKSKHIREDSAFNGYVPIIHNPKSTAIEYVPVFLNSSHHKSEDDGHHNDVNTEDRHSSQTVTREHDHSRCSENLNRFWTKGNTTISQERILTKEVGNQQCIEHKAEERHSEKSSAENNSRTKGYPQSCTLTSMSYGISGHLPELLPETNKKNTSSIPVTKMGRTQSYYTRENSCLTPDSKHANACPKDNLTQALTHNTSSNAEEVKLMPESVADCEGQGMTCSSSLRMENRINIQMGEKILSENKSTQAEVTKNSVSTAPSMKYTEKCKNCHEEEGKSNEEQRNVRDREANVSGSTCTKSVQIAPIILDNSIFDEDLLDTSETSTESNSSGTEKHVVRDLNFKGFGVNIKSEQKQYIVSKDLPYAGTKNINDKKRKEEEKGIIVMGRIWNENTLSEESKSEEEEDVIINGLWKERHMQTDIKPTEKKCINKNEIKVQDSEPDSIKEMYGDETNSEDEEEEEMGEDKDGVGKEGLDDEVGSKMLIRKVGNDKCPIKREEIKTMQTHEEEGEISGEDALASREEESLLIPLTRRSHRANKGEKKNNSQKGYITVSDKEISKCKKENSQDCQNEEDNDTIMGEAEEDGDEEQAEMSEENESVSLHQESEDEPEDSEEENTDFWGSKDDLSISQCEGEHVDMSSQPEIECSETDDKEDSCMSNEEAAHLQKSALVAVTSQEVLPQDEPADMENKRPVWLCCLSSCPLPEIFNKRMEKRCSEDCAMSGLQMSPLECSSLLPTQEFLPAPSPSNTDEEQDPETHCEDSSEEACESDNKSKNHTWSDSDDDIHSFFDK